MRASTAPMVALLLTGTAIGCHPVRVHSLVVLNATPDVIEEVTLETGSSRTGLGGIAPGIDSGFGLTGKLVDHVIVHWREGYEKRMVIVDVSGIREDFRGTIVLEVRAKQEVRVILQPPIPGI